ncbi:MAG TPA: hypothetical protein VFY24_09365, partial [Azospira sp.]|nr:hypothetical protein [Azospira sp.]
MKALRLTPIACALIAVANNAAAETVPAVVETATVHVVGTTPLAGVGVPREQIPANVQSVGA